MACAVIAEVASRGIDVRPFFELIGLDPRSALDPERKVSAPALFELWGACMRATRDPGLPVKTASRLKLEDYQVLGFAAMTSPSTRAALALATRFSGLLVLGARWSIREHPEEGRVRLEWVREGARSLGLRTANECAVAELLHAIRQALGSAVVPLAVGFRHQAPGPSPEHARFFGLPPRFESGWDGFELPLALLDQVPRHANPSLAAFLEQQMERLLGHASHPATLAGRIAAIVEKDLATGEPDMARVARALAMSERTLRRQLAEEGTTFRDLVEQVRSDRARALLSARAASIDEIAFLLGFSETSAFARAFKRWTGRTPGQFRDAAAA